ncbi:hypothetical protein PF008_g26180 [Phytophthora fragariae]|uniref:Uncharacterized protein n=1 Tax=Phytophthora fragariae TaxID=53985 RepID=A0A6G0QIF4_9STRA|nr:hypothetical protein PF008_g26180 [Phytophthora fragariae]
MSTNRRAVCLAVTSVGTAARCTTLLNRSTKTTIPVLRLLSGGRPNTKSIEMDCQHSDGVMGPGLASVLFKENGCSLVWTTPTGVAHKN